MYVPASVCLAGTAGATLASSAQCKRCAAGRFAPTGAMACSACPTGMRSEEAASICYLSAADSSTQTAALLDPKAAAAACLGKVAPKDLCGWEGNSGLHRRARHAHLPEPLPPHVAAGIDR